MDDRTINQADSQVARIWGSGGRAYDNVSFAISDALAHAAQRLSPPAGSKVLDIATGTGWSARNAARQGAHVTGIDISLELLQAAQDLSTGFSPPIKYLQASAERLPFDDGEFDRVISTFGVMFAADHEKAAGEIIRVCKPGGKISIATWAPEGAVAEFFGLIAGFSNEAPAPVSPLAWGDPGHVRDLLGNDFDLVFETGWNHAYHDSAEAIWQWYLEGFGPLKTLHDSLDEPGRRKLREQVDAYHEHYRCEAGLCVKREYLVTIGTRH